ncbi:MAG: DUF3619 family protein [Polynucleobacter sp.]|nr:DUF3619 family protein [Polynucleobacter sp.]
MNRDQDLQFETDRIGSAVREHLDGSTAQLPSRITDRLYHARLSAMAARKQEFVPQLERVLRPQLAFTQGGSGSHPSSYWNRLSWFAPFIVLALGLLAISEWQQDERINDIAAVDIALLSDDVPPDAYMDSGFLAFLKLSSHAKRELETTNSENADTAVDPS